VAHAVHHAHARGILHRDLKPANILIDELGKPHVTDFGLAKRVRNEPEALATGLTQTGVIVGTPSYMAPEQAAGKKDLTIAVDVWSLGAILYECLTGQPPFRGATAIDTLLQVTEQEPSRPRAINPDIPRDLETICLKCLEKEPARRYDGAEELAKDLERWLAGEPIHARPAGLSERAVKWARRRPAAAALAIVSAVALLSLLLFAGALWHNAEQRALAREDLDIARKQTAAARTEVNRIRAEARYLEEKVFREQITARRIRYAADMHSAHAAWEANNVPRMVALLERYASAEELGGKSLHVPRLDEIDPRGFEWRYLWHLCHGEQRGWLAHRPPASAPGSPASQPVLVAFSPDGKTLASASLDEPLQLWDRATGRLLRTLLKPSGPVLSLAFSADGKSLEVVTADPSRSAAPHDPKPFRDVFDGKTKPSLRCPWRYLRIASCSPSAGCSPTAKRRQRKERSCCGTWRPTRRRGSSASSLQSVPWPSGAMARRSLPVTSTAKSAFGTLSAGPNRPARASRAIPLSCCRWRSRRTASHLPRAAAMRW
jgi:hypothetical protein